MLFVTLFLCDPSVTSHSRVKKTLCGHVNLASENCLSIRHNWKATQYHWSATRSQKVVAWIKCWTWFLFESSIKRHCSLQKRRHFFRANEPLSECRARDTPARFPLRACLALLAHFTLAFVRPPKKREKLTPVLQAKQTATIGRPRFDARQSRQIVGIPVIT